MQDFSHLMIIEHFVKHVEQRYLSGKPGRSSTRLLWQLRHRSWNVLSALERRYLVS